MPRVCFTVQVDPQRLTEYRQRHTPVWPEMLREIAASGRRDYSLFLRDDGLLIGYYETDSDEASAAYLAGSAVAARWEASMQEFFVGLGGRADQSAVVVPEVFNLDQQLADL
ncbi:L-rhamnose mutarotase [Microlunatus speluncae]|uniref:L-rhamnose mutarotase n=1 Tax=Microlunatus speluncae TaxID=2594267 RepID=UPI001266715D|nr:L-rhamnose mutarotase [Microlunatus speluncae]